MFAKLLDEWLNLDCNIDADDVHEGMTVAVLNDFARWLDTRSPTLRAADNPDTTEALFVDVYEWVYENTDGDVETFREFRRFLRERLARS